MKNCKIIRDLFPSYIDGLTNEETNQYIKEHLKECEECKKVLENMQKELKSDTTKKDSKEVKYIKKFNSKMKILKILLLVILLIFVLSIARNMLIIASLNNKISNYTDSTNYHTKSLNYSGDGLTIIENYKKDEKYIRRVKFLSEEDGEVIQTDYYNGKTINTYIEMESEEKNESRNIAILNKGDNINLPVIPNAMKIDYPLQFIVTSLFSSITSGECNGKDCYRIVQQWFNNDSETIYYIEKETGLTIRMIGETKSINKYDERFETITDFRYELDAVTDNDFIEPDISEYEIEE